MLYTKLITHGDQNESIAHEGHTINNDEEESLEEKIEPVKKKPKFMLSGMKVY